MEGAFLEEYKTTEAFRIACRQTAQVKAEWDAAYAAGIQILEQGRERLRGQTEKEKNIFSKPMCSSLQSVLQEHKIKQKKKKKKKK